MYIVLVLTYLTLNESIEADKAVFDLKNLSQIKFD